MAWWSESPDERYWCEITDRLDLGADLKCPQADDNSDPYWSYSLIHELQPRDIVFHYSTRADAYVGASIAGGPVEERPIVWQAHGKVGRQKTSEPCHVRVGGGLSIRSLRAARH